MCDRGCYWNYDNTCVSESLETLYDDDTYETDNCIGWLRHDFEDVFWSTYAECKNLLDMRNCKELIEILNFIKSQREEVFSADDMCDL